MELPHGNVFVIVVKKELLLEQVLGQDDIKVADVPPQDLMQKTKLLMACPEPGHITYGLE